MLIGGARTVAAGSGGDAGILATATIPRLFHQIWLGASPLPDEFAAYAESWRRHHPEWEYLLWTEDTIPPDVRPEILERLRAPAERADMLRYELLCRHGGVYADSDFECLRPLDELIAGLDFFVSEYRRGRVNNAIIGAVPGHPVLQELLREVRPRTTWGYDKHATGPLLLERVVRGHDVRVFDRALFYPEWPERHDAYAYHHMSRSWKDASGLRRSIAIAEERTEEAERALARLRGGRPQRHPLRRLRWLRTRVERRISPYALRLRARLARSRPQPTAIPRVLHVVQLASEPLSANVDAWRLAHPDWSWRVWREIDLPQGLRPEIYDPLRAPAERADLLRLEVLAREGGAAFDASLPCGGRIDALLGQHEAAALADASFVASIPNAPAIVYARDHAEPTGWFTPGNPGTAAAAVARARKAGLPLELLSRAAFTASDPREDLEGVRDRLLRAEARQHEAEDALASARAAQPRDRE